MTSSNILMLSHGHRVRDSDDRFLKLSDVVTDDFSLLATPGRYFVDYLPACELPPMTFKFVVNPKLTVRYVPSWFPGTGWQQAAKEYAHHVACAVTEPYEAVKREIVRSFHAQSESIQPNSNPSIPRLREQHFPVSALAIWKDFPIARQNPAVSSWRHWPVWQIVMCTETQRLAGYSSVQALT